jgi:hypothetical protein
MGCNCGKKQPAPIIAIATPEPIQTPTPPTQN